MKSERFVQRVFFGLTALFVFFIIYASWTPGAPIPGGGRRHFIGLRLSDFSLVHDLRDITTNVLLYIPLGLFLALAVSRRRPKFVSPWLIIGPLVSSIMETGQSFIGRSPDVVDIMTNTVGYAIGYWMVVSAVRFYGLSPAVVLGFGPEEAQDTRTRTIAALRFIYVCIYILVAVLPFDMSVSASRIYAQLLPDDMGRVRIILDPTYQLRHWHENGLKLTLDLLSLVPIGALTTFLSVLRGRTSIFTGVYATVVVAVAGEIAQIFILSRTTDIVMIPIAVVAGILGWGFVRIWFHLQNAELASVHRKSGKAWSPAFIALIGYGLVILFFTWSPFHFEGDPTTVAKKIIYDSNLVPFKEHFEARDISAAVDIVKEAGLFAPFGILMSYLLVAIRPSARRWKIVLLSAAGCVVFATFTELSQAVCVDRYIDITDILLAGFGGLCGAMLLGLFRFRRMDAGGEPLARR
jgi:glycopeptide antibiotics resistance protein